MGLKSSNRRVARSELNLFWEPHDKGLMLERLLQSFLRLHLNYYLWYAKRIFDYACSLDDLMNPPVAPVRIERVSDESQISRYGLAFGSSLLRKH